jgi:hypothetical protein
METKKDRRFKKTGQVPCFVYYPMWRGFPKQCCHQRLCSSCRIQLARINKYRKLWRGKYY